VSNVGIWYARLLTFLGGLSGVLIAIFAVLIGYDVAMRNLQLGSLPWIVELSEYSLLAITFLAAPWVLACNGHVRVDVLLTAWPPRIGRAIAFVIDAFGLVISAIFLYYGAGAVSAAISNKALLFKQLVIPEWWTLAPVPIGAALLTIEFALRLVRQYRSERVGAGSSDKT